MTTRLNVEVLDPASIAALLANGIPPCICEGLGKKMDTIEEAAAYRPPWVRDYCLSHGRRKPVLHDMDRFPGARNSYACDPCRSGDHVRCQHEIRLPDWSAHCACDGVAQDAHVEVAREAKRNALAEVIYASGQDPANAWLSTVDGTPNSASYAIAEALIEQGLA